MTRKVPPARRKDVAADASVDDVAQQVMTWVGLSMRLAHARPMTDNLGMLNELGLTLPQLVALHVIAFEGPTTMTRLVERVGLSTSAVSALLHRLVELGLCERRDDPLDRRQRRMRLSVAGQHVIKKLVQSRMNDTRGSIEPLSPRARALLSEALRVVIEELAQLGVADHQSSHRSPGDLDRIFERIDVGDDVEEHLLGSPQLPPRPAHKAPKTSAIKKEKS